MYDHLGTWTTQDMDGAAGRLDLWDTGRTGEYGKSVLRYCLAIVADDTDSRRGVTLFEGEDYSPSPLVAIDSDETAGGLLGFFSAYGESIRWSGEDADVPAFTPQQRETLAAQHEHLAMWSNDLENADEKTEV